MDWVSTLFSFCNPAVDRMGLYVLFGATFFVLEQYIKCKIHDKQAPFMGSNVDRAIFVIGLLIWQSVGREDVGIWSGVGLLALVVGVGLFDADIRVKWPLLAIVGLSFPFSINIVAYWAYLCLALLVLASNEVCGYVTRRNCCWFLILIPRRKSGEKNSGVGCSERAKPNVRQDAGD